MTTSVLWKGKTQGIYSIAKQEHVAPGILYRRWKNAGCPPVMPKEVVESAKNAKRLDTSGYTVDGEHFPTLAEVCKRFGRSMSYYSERFGELGSRECTLKELHPPRKQNEERIVTADGQQIRVGSLFRLWPELERTPHFFRHAWHRMGRPDVVTKEDFIKWSAKHKPTNKRTSHAAPDFNNPNYLPHIPSGDLAHLKGSGANTGAGKGSIPDSEWIGMTGGRLQSISAGCCGISLSAFNR